MSDRDGVLLIVQYQASTTQRKWREYDRASNYDYAERIAREADTAGYAAVRIINAATREVVER